MDLGSMNGLRADRHSRFQACRERNGAKHCGHTVMSFSKSKNNFQQEQQQQNSASPPSFQRAAGWAVKR